MSILGSIKHLSALITSKQLTSIEITENALQRATSHSGEGGRTFTKIYKDSSLAAAEIADQIPKSGLDVNPLRGLPVSVKDLFDIRNETTLAGSRVLSNTKVASEDATVVKRLRASGAVLIGKTNMTEFAYSGLGLNPHFGTPLNPYDRSNRRIPGGSSSGAAISVTDGMAVAAIGTDTGGSVRIPAALCGLTGFKPTACRIPTDGVIPLSTSLDSVGSIAPTVDCCAQIDAVLTGSSAPVLGGRSVANLRFGYLDGYVLEGLDRWVAYYFDAALSALSQAGASIEKVNFLALSQIADCNSNGGFAAAESYAWHRRYIDASIDQYDPRVSSRILRGKQISAADYIDLLKERSRIKALANLAFGEFDVWLLPTVPRIAPLLEPLESSDELYTEINFAMLRNPSVFNFLDWCALSIPCHQPGEAPVGLMIAARHGMDQELLSVGSAIERVMAEAGCAVVGMNSSC
ncbi:MAG: amidase [Burkholderiales bacterium]|nr:amidase [Burkholderiales bacterium]